MHPESADRMLVFVYKSWALDFSAQCKNNWTVALLLNRPFVVLGRTCFKSSSRSCHVCTEMFLTCWFPG